MTYTRYETAKQVSQLSRWRSWSRDDWLASVEDIIFEHDRLGVSEIPFSGDHVPREPRPEEERCCLQCGETEGAIKASQRSGDPIYCAGDFSYEYGEPGWEQDRHRFREWSDKELDYYRIAPRYRHKYRRMNWNGYDIDPAHQVSEKELTRSA